MSDLIKRHEEIIKQYKPKNGKFLIYGLIDPNTKELRYIGKSCKGLRRARASSREYYLETHKGRWLKGIHKENKLPIIIIINLFKSRESVARAEQKYISFFRGKGYPLTNIDDGGEGFSKSSRNNKPYKGLLPNGLTLPEFNKNLWATNKEFREEQISKAKERWKDPIYRSKIIKIAKSRYTPKVREKISESVKRFHQDPQKKAKYLEKMGVGIIATNLNDGTKLTFNSITDCANRLHAYTANINKVLKGTRKQSAGHTFQYVNRENKTYKPKYFPKEIRATSLLDGKIYEFKSTKEACDKMGFCDSKIPAVIRGKRKHHRNFTFQYINKAV